MAYFYSPDAEQVVKDAITAAGGKVSHAALVQTLKAAGNGEIAQSLLPLSQNGVIVGRVEAQPVGKPVLFYSLPS